MISGEQGLAKLVGSVYEAASDAAHWKVFLSGLSEVAGADAAACVFHFWDRNVHTVRSSWNLDPQADRLYEEHYVSVDVWAHRARWKPAGYLCVSETLCPEAELATTEIYNDFMLRYDVVHGMFGVVENSTARWASVSLFRSPRSGGFENGDLKILDFLMPHMQRAFKLDVQIAELKGRSEGVEAALNQLATGIVFLGANGKVILMNRAAEEACNRRDGLFLERGEISAGLACETMRLRGLIADAAQTGSGRGLGAGGTMVVSRCKGRPLSLTISPLREFDRSLVQRPAAAMFISDPERCPEVRAEMLRRSYGLTQAEARLAQVLLQGCSLKEAANMCSVTHNTAKSQLKSIFSKTQVRRQGELIRLLLGSALSTGA